MLDAAIGAQLPTLARAAIASALTPSSPAPAVTADFPAVLRQPGASFVTLTRDAALRGCIGSLIAHRPLAEDVVHNARTAAFADPRFPPLAARELPEIRIEVAVLEPPRPLPASDLSTLKAMIVPGADGLVVECGRARGTLLPKVWESLPDPDIFLTALWRKAGLTPGTWPVGLRVYAYRTQAFAEPNADAIGGANAA